MMTRRMFAFGVPLAAVTLPKASAAGVDGKWEAEIETPRGPTVIAFTLQADGESLTGTVGNDMLGMSEIEDGEVRGDSVSFVQVMARGQMQVRFKYEGTVAGDEMELTRTMQRPPGMPGGGGRGPGRGQGRRPRGPGRWGGRVDVPAAVLARAGVAAAWAAARSRLQPSGCSERLRPQGSEPGGPARSGSRPSVAESLSPPSPFGPDLAQWLPVQLPWLAGGAARGFR